MKKNLIFCVCVLIFASCSITNNPEDIVKAYYEHLIKKEYRELIKTIDWGQNANDADFEEKIAQLEAKEPTDEDVTNYEIISQEKQTKDGEEYIMFTVKEFSKAFPEGKEENIPVHKDTKGEWKIFLGAISK